VPAYSLTRGALPKEAIEAAFPNRNNNRGLFAATQFESAKGGAAKFTFEGGPKAVWINGKVVTPASELTVQVRPGVNTIVLQLDDVKPADVTVRSADVAFVLSL
jgi:hypothetical protein